MNKAHIRTAALQQRQSLGQQQRDLFSQIIIASLLQHLSISAPAARCLLMYRSIASEVSTDRLLEHQKYHLYAPVTQRDASMQWLEISADTRWRTGVMGILEPESGPLWQHYLMRAEGGPERDATKLGATVLLCPLSAFDRQGNRLGMGHGCFDRWLSAHAENIQQVIGLAFSCQEVAQLPIEDHDMPMDYIVTEKEVIQCQK